MRLSELHMIELLPHFMREDETIKTLCNSVDKLITDVAIKIDEISVWDAIDILDHGTLDELAWEMDIDWWETAWDIKVKRDTIRTAIKIMSKRGTKSAVINAVANAFGSGYVEEWFEYDGEPYHFIAGTEEVITEEKIENFLKLVEIAKNERSVLELVEAARKIEADAKVGSIVYGYSELEVF